ncbi:MAG: hypothetical protein EBY22_14720 [Gammaproteobacteria bacterium]|nr:hypothetical protein [Gammaproteobacteria bacterium]
MSTNKSNEWVPLAAGGYNEVYVNVKSGLVFKSAHNPELDTDTPERSVRLWNILNPYLHPKAQLSTIMIDGAKVYGWTCPYVRNQYNKQPSSLNYLSWVKTDRTAYKQALQDLETRKEEDQAIVASLIDIYNRTGRVIVDAAVPGNFVTIEPGKAICIDIGMALLLEKQETDCLNAYTSRKSDVSNMTWTAVHTDIYTRILQDKNSPFPETVLMTKALLFIRAYRPDIRNIDFLKKSKSCIEQLANAYDAESDTAHDNGIELLDQKRPVNLISIKKACTEKLLEYIHSRGTLDQGNMFQASWITKFFRNTLLTQLKIDSAQLLIKKINNAQSINEIKTAVVEASKPRLLKKGFNSNFSTVLGLCKVISQIPPSASPELSYRSRSQSQ